MIDPEERIVSLHDVKRLYFSMWQRLTKWLFIGALVAFFYFGHREVTYKASCSFKEGVEKSSSENFFKELILGVNISTVQPQAVSLMTSNQVLREVVEKLGLQIEPGPTGWLLARVLRRYRDTWRAEKGLLPLDRNRFDFTNVQYDQEGPLFFQIVFSSTDEYAVFSKKRKEELARGVLGKPCSFSGLHFTLEKAPCGLEIGKSYPFSVSDWVATVNKLREQIKIKSDKDNSSILRICVIDQDRHLAMQIANKLMLEYQDYLKTEYDAIAKTQLSYLEGKQEQIFGKMDQLLTEHIDYLRQNLEKNGFLGLEDETKSLLDPYYQMHGKLLCIDVELNRLEQVEKGGEGIHLFEEGSFSQGVTQIVQKIEDLRQQRDLIELTLAKGVEPFLHLRGDQLKEIRDARLAVERLRGELECGGEIAASDLNPGPIQWAAALSDSLQREDFIEYLTNYSRLLSMREKMQQERHFYGERLPQELEGIDLASARTLFLQYNSKLDAAEVAIRHYAKLKESVQNPQFDLSTLSSVLNDPMSQKIIAEASGHEMKMKDEKHRSEKEEQRWRGEIALQRKMLIDHLDQLSVVQELDADLMRDKMFSLQKVSLDCINQQISVLHEQMRDATKKRHKSLLMEKAVLEKKMEEIRSLLATMMPEKWRFEKWLELKTAMVNNVMKTVTEVVESKTITNHLHHVESKPLDLAFLPQEPRKPYLFLMVCLGAFVFPFLIFSWALIQRLMLGFGATEEALSAMRFPVLGQISAFCDGRAVETPTGGDLEVLRKMALFAEGGKVIGLIGGDGPDYSYALGENLARRRACSLVVRCDFHAKMGKEEAPGILQMWNGEIEELPIRQGAGFDYITAGGYSRFGTEIVQSERFGELIAEIKEKYDWVFLLFKSPLSSVESQAALCICDKAIVTVSGEQIEELTPFVHWGYDRNNCRITFITRG